MFSNQKNKASDADAKSNASGLVSAMKTCYVETQDYTDCDGVGATDKLGNTPLHYAADRNQVEMAKLLLDLGAAADPVNRNGMTPLMIAAGRGDLEIVTALLAKGANPNKTDFTGRDAIGWASDSRRPIVVQTLQRAAVGKR